MIEKDDGHRRVQRDGEGDLVTDRFAELPSGRCNSPWTSAVRATSSQRSLDVGVQSVDARQQADGLFDGQFAPA